MKNQKKLLHVAMKVVLSVLSVMLFAQANALNSSQATVTNGTGPYFYADDGNCGTREVPRAAYVAIDVLNISGATLNNVKVKLVKMTNTSSGFKMLSFKDDSTMIIPQILDDSTKGALFYIQYPCTKSLSTTLTFKLWDPSNNDTITFNTTITTYDVGPTQSGGDVIYQNLQANPILGALIADTVRYEFGNYNKGVIFFQPCGDTLFPVDDLILIESVVVSSSISACGPKPGDKNKLYWNGTTGCGGGSGNQVTVIYYYLNALYNDTAYFKPYSGMTSGQPIKYTNNYAQGVAADTFFNTASANNFNVTKTADCGICTPGSNIKYTIKIHNTASVPLMFDRIMDSLPMNHTFVGIDGTSEVTTSNSSVYPANGATGNIEFIGLIPETFPYRSYYIDANDSISLVYEVDPPNTSSNTLYQNRAFGMVGNQSFDTAYALTCVGCSALPVELIRFEGNIINNRVRLEWSTASEIDNYGFDVYRVNPDNSKIHLGFVEGHGNSTVRQDYFLMDEMPIVGSQVYELVQRDFDGRTESFFTSVHMPRLIVENPSISVFPNPTTDKLNVRSESGDQLITAKLFGLDGKLLAESEGDAAINIFINTGHLNLGIYILEVASEGEIVSRRKIYKH